MNNAIRIMALVFSGLMLASCDSGDSNKASASPDKAFSVSLEHVDIRRVSNGETVDIDTTGITSEKMTLKKK